MSEAEWYELENVIESAYKDFKKSIGNVCQLKKQELRVCLLLKAGFSPINIKASKPPPNLPEGRLSEDSCSWKQIKNCIRQ